MVGNFPALLNFNRLFLKLNRFICNYLPVLPDHCLRLGSHDNETLTPLLLCAFCCEEKPLFEGTGTHARVQYCIDRTIIFLHFHVRNRHKRLWKDEYVKVGTCPSGEMESPSPGSNPHGEQATQATSNHVPWEEHGTCSLNPMGHNVTNGKFACPMAEGNHHGINQSEMHQIWELVSSHNCPSQSKG